jgi:hypothetical protein
MSWFHRTDGEEPWKRLVETGHAGAAPTNADSHELIHTRPDSDEPNDAADRLVTFSYCDANGEVTTRTVQVSRCWQSGAVIYVRGECQFRHAMRTFRADRMANLWERKSGQQIADPVAYFGHFSDTAPQGGPQPAAMAKAGRAVHRDLEDRAAQWHRHHAARRACIDGLRVIAYTTLCSLGWNEPDRNIEESYIEARFAMVGFERDEAITQAMMKIGAGLAPPFSSFLRSANLVASEQMHFELVRDCVHAIIDINGAFPGEAEAYHRLMAAGAACGYR